MVLRLGLYLVSMKPVSYFHFVLIEASLLVLSDAMVLLLRCYSYLEEMISGRANIREEVVLFFHRTRLIRNPGGTHFEPAGLQTISVVVG